MTTTGTTVFAMGSHHAIKQTCELWRDKNMHTHSPYRVVQPILNVGDMVCFGGSLLHFGAANNFIYDDNSLDNAQNETRILLYAVLHLLDENSDAEYLKSDSNIVNIERLTSIQMSRYLIAKNNNTTQQLHDNTYILFE